jgi:hypothetical protein
MLSFCPDKVMLGYRSAFVLTTLRCYRCQAYGHVAAVCRREVPRCEEYAEGQETKECIALGKVVVCVQLWGCPWGWGSEMSCAREAG